MLGRCLRGQSRFDEAERVVPPGDRADPARISCYTQPGPAVPGRPAARRGRRRRDPGDGRAEPGVRPRLHRADGGTRRSSRRRATPATSGGPWSWGPTTPRCGSPPPSRASRGRTRPGRESTGRRAGRSIPAMPPWPSAWPAWRCARGISIGPRPSCGERIEVKASVDLAFELAEVLIFQGKIEGDDQAEGYIARLRAAGFGETLVRFLEAEILVQRQRWAEAIARIERDRAVLRSFPRLAARLDLMLADCYGRMGADELRLDALRRAAEGDQGGTRPRRARPGAGAVRPARPGDRDPRRRWRSRAPTRSGGSTSSGCCSRRRSACPRDRRDWREVESHLREAENATGRRRPSRSSCSASTSWPRRAGSTRPGAARPIAGEGAPQPRLPAGDGAGDAATRPRRRGPADHRPGREGPGAEPRSQPGPTGLLGDERGRRGQGRGGETGRGSPAAPGGRSARLPRSPRDRPRSASAICPRRDDTGASRRCSSPATSGRCCRSSGWRWGEADSVDAEDLVAKMRAAEGEQGTLLAIREGDLSARPGPTWQGFRLEATPANSRRSMPWRPRSPNGAPNWWGGPLIEAEIAELEGRRDDVLAAYQRAVDLG